MRLLFCVIFWDVIGLFVLLGFYLFPIYLFGFVVH
jgi:hypothetical protein